MPDKKPIGVVPKHARNDEAAPTRPRMPMQHRAWQRVEAALAAAEQMIGKLGPEQVSIPEIAKAANIPRASLYQFFPDKYALLARLAEIHMGRVIDLVAQGTRVQAYDSYHAYTRALINTVSDYYDATPAANILVLGGPYSRSAYLAQENTVSKIGDILREAIETQIPAITIPRSPDVATLAVEIAFACMKHGYYEDGHISEVIREQAVTAVVAYVQANVPEMGKAFSEQTLK